MKAKINLKEALSTQLEITQTAPSFVEFWAEKSGNAALLNYASDKNAAREFSGNHQIVDVVKQQKQKLKHKHLLMPYVKLHRVYIQSLLHKLKLKKKFI